MNEKLKEFAAQAGFNLSGDYHCDEYELERFAELVRQDEREAIAKLVEADGRVHPKALEADIDFLWAVNRADIAALKDAEKTLETIRKTVPIKTLNPMIYQSLSLIYTALDMSHSDAFCRIIDKARGQK